MTLSLHAGVAITRMPHGTDLALPAYETAGAAGMDLRAAIPAGAPLMLPPGVQVVVPTGIAIALPAGLEAQVRPRSGLARKFGIFIPNAPGTIDSDYTGEIQVILARHGAPGSAADYEIKRGDRVAQLIVAPVVRVSWREVSTLTPVQTDGPLAVRGAKGFGSTGDK